eukprot:1153891-Pelagomonas_calceolata.AAC.1
MVTDLGNKCDWYTVQDEEHVILDCPSRDLTDLRTQPQHLFSSAPPSSASRLRRLHEPGSCPRISQVRVCMPEMLLLSF